MKLFRFLLSFLARVYAKKHTPYVVGITGSIGKTTCRSLLTKVLIDSLEDTTVYTSPKNFNTEIGLALSILQIESFVPSFFGALLAFVRALKMIFLGDKVDVLVLEYGIDHPGDMDALLAICRPDIAVFTGLDVVHCEYFGSPDDILEEKMKLFSAAKDIAFYPSSALYLDGYLEQLEIDVLSYSFESGVDADIGFESYSTYLSTGGTVMSTFHIDQGSEDLFTLETNLLGKIPAGYVSLSIEIAMILGRRLEKEFVQKNYFEFVLQSGRFGLFAGKEGHMLIDSTYNAAPKSMKEALSLTIQLRNELFPDYGLMYCLGDMNELGDFSEAEHRNLASIISQSADLIFLVGNETLVTKDELLKIGYNQQRVYYFPDSHSLGRHLQDTVGTFDPSLILFKGSQQGVFLEEAIAYILSDEQDKGRLPRQDDRWLSKKQHYFMNLEDDKS